MIYDDMEFTVIFDRDRPTTFNLVVWPPGGPQPNDPTPNDIEKAVAQLRAAHLAAKAAGKGGGRSDRGPRVVRVSGDLAGMAGAWDVLEIAGMSGRAGVGEGGGDLWIAMGSN